MARFISAWYPEGNPGREPRVPDLSAARYELPLDVLFEAFDSALSGGAPLRLSAPTR